MIASNPNPIQRIEFSVLAARQLLLLIAFFSPLTPSVPAADKPAVSINISVPKQKTYVIGDDINLNWHFQNDTTNHLAFMWEGCCRINGRVEMKRLGPPTIPKTGLRPQHRGYGPGIYNPYCLHCKLERQKTELDVAPAPMGPATAHMFARPVRLPAGGTEKISSTLANWVLLEETGDYQLSGAYLGVHPKQQPQMPRNAQLWTNVSKSPVIDLALLSVDDYLAEREARSRVRAVRLEMRGDPAVQPFTDLGMTVTLSNLADETVMFHWPGHAEFWVVDDKGRRLAESRHVITRYGQEVILPAHETTTVELPVSTEIFAGRSFGRYRAFVELKETEKELRVPSNPIDLEWDLSPATVRQLLHDAGDRPAIGARNPPLKLLRQHLADLRDILPSVDTSGLNSKSVSLAADLTDAATLSKHHPRPGRVTLNVAVSKTGSITFQDPAVNEAIDTKQHPSPAARLERVLALRRHLGWTIGLSLRIAPEAKLAAVRQLLEEIRPSQSSLAGRPETKAFNRYATAYSQISFADPAAAPEKSDLLHKPDLASRLEQTKGAPRLVLPPSLTWQEVLKASAPLVDTGRRFEILIRP